MVSGAYVVEEERPAGSVWAKNFTGMLLNWSFEGPVSAPNPKKPDIELKEEKAEVIEWQSAGAEGGQQQQCDCCDYDDDDYHDHHHHHNHHHHHLHHHHQPTHSKKLNRSCACNTNTAAQPLIEAAGSHGNPEGSW
jgi:hypothetical protein